MTTRRGVRRAVLGAMVSAALVGLAALPGCGATDCDEAGNYIHECLGLPPIDTKDPLYENPSCDDAVSQCLNDCVLSTPCFMIRAGFSGTEVGGKMAKPLSDCLLACQLDH